MINLGALQNHRHIYFRAMLHKAVINSHPFLISHIIHIINLFISLAFICVGEVNRSTYV